MNAAALTVSPDDFGYREIAGLNKLPLATFTSNPPGPSEVSVSRTKWPQESFYLSYRSRVSELKQYAEEDGFTINLASELDFWNTVKSVPLKPEADLVLRDNGNLRVVWKDKEGNRLALYFLGNRTVQYVIFAPALNRPEGLSDTVSLGELKSLIERKCPAVLE